ncbi:MAG: hypothetical protein P9L92_05920 [Candidatus Electryonea clarkiae]|nr:hypothetical protein [Candidatus Electryonea clarkiae]MDP8288777.1 hypothetical protein [Candidatus Electryonea clarkiae]
MKSLLIVILSMVAFAFIIGCSVTLPQTSMINEEYIATPEKFEVIGDVQGEATVAVLFGFIPITNDRGFLLAYNNALLMAQADGLIEIFSDVKHFNFLGIYRSETTIVYAKAIKYI